MKKTYRDLDLKAIREFAGLDFAYHTFMPGQCTCCYGMLDIPHGWKKGKREEAQRTGDYTGILFQNADNGSGRIRTKSQLIEDYTCVGWKCSDSQKDRVCMMLMEQLGNEYAVVTPRDDSECILIRYRPEMEDCD